MAWTKNSIFTERGGIDTVLGLLIDFGIDSTQISDNEEFSEFLEENKKAWDYVDENLRDEMAQETRIDFYTQQNDARLLNDIKSALLELKARDNENAFGRLELISESIEGQDWMNSWKQYFHSFTVSDKLIIKPYWEDVVSDGKKVFEINPGLSFGTGTHHTTKMCLEDIVNLIKEGDLVLDLGAGSGILSIVSLIFGASRAVSVDIDENSFKTISENLERNKIDKDKCDIYIGDILEDSSIQEKILETEYDAVLVNIVADVVISLLPLVRKAIKQEGIFIASGIIEDRISEVKEKIISSGFIIISEKRSADWAEFVCKLQG